MKRLKFKRFLVTLLGNRKREPVRAVRSIASGIAVAVFLLTTWGIDVSADLQDRINTTVGTLVPVLIIVGEFIRPYVTPVEKAEKAIDAAWIADPAIDSKPELAEMKA